MGGFTAIAVAAFDAAAIDPIAAGAIKNGIAIVSYITRLTHQTAAITVDRVAAGRALAKQAARHGKRVLLVGPPAQPAIPLPFAAGFPEIEAAIRDVVHVRATVEAQADSDAKLAVAAGLEADPSLDIVLCWNDLTALGAAAAADNRVYVGGLGAPSLTSAASLDALHKRGPLRCLVAARVSDLANALIDFPLARARGQKPRTRTVPTTVLEAGGAELAAFASDFAG